MSQLTTDLQFLPELESLTFIVLELSELMPHEVDTLSNMLYARRHSFRHFEIRSQGPLPRLDPRAGDLAAKGMQIRLENDLGLDAEFS